VESVTHFKFNIESPPTSQKPLTIAHLYVADRRRLLNSTRSSAVAERPCDPSCHSIFC